MASVYLKDDYNGSMDDDSVNIFLQSKANLLFSDLQAPKSDNFTNIILILRQDIWMSRPS